MCLDSYGKQACHFISKNQDFFPDHQSLPEPISFLQQKTLWPNSKERREADDLSVDLYREEWESSTNPLQMCLRLYSNYHGGEGKFIEAKLATTEQIGNWIWANRKCIVGDWKSPQTNLHGVWSHANSPPPPNALFDHKPWTLKYPNRIF